LELLCNRQIGAFNQSKADKSKSFAKGPTLFCFVGTEKVFEHSGFPKSSDIPPTAKRIFKAFTELPVKTHLVCWQLNKNKCPALCSLSAQVALKCI